MSLPPDDHLIGLDASGQRYPVHASRAVDRDAGRGALLGIVVGHALGGGDPAALRPGVPGAPAQLACCLSASLMAEGRLDPDDLAARYLEWSRHDAGLDAETRGALARIAAGAAPTDAGRAVW